MNCPYAVPILGEVYDTLGQRYKCECYSDIRCDGDTKHQQCVYYRTAFLPHQITKTYITSYPIDDRPPLGHTLDGSTQIMLSYSYQETRRIEIMTLFEFDLVWML